MSEHPLDLSTRVIDSGVADAPVNRLTQELSELADGIALVESFSHAVVVDTADGLVVFDTSGAKTGPEVVGAIRRWSDAPIASIVYTHGHLDHIGGSRAFAADAERRHESRPRVVGHHRIIPRLARYHATSGYNRLVNLRQFGGAATTGVDTDRPFVPAHTMQPDVVYHDRLIDHVGDVEFEHNACMGETDDHTWTWIPSCKTITAGDQFIWMFPNCGNPQKVQRYPLEWAQSLRDMASRDVELFVPAHGLPIAGQERIRRCLDVVATTLERLVAEVVDAMNTGATLDEIVHGVTLPDETLQIPYLRPMYDEPEFVIRNIWRLYGGWWDANPARLKPPSDTAASQEVASLAGGAERLVDRATELSASGDHRLACQVIEWAAAAEPESHAVHTARAEIYSARRSAETSLMAKGIYLSATNESRRVITGETPDISLVLQLGDDT